MASAYYIDDQSFDPELMCNICGEHFKDPYCTPCDHTFCHQCITQRIFSGSAICPRCAKPISIHNLKPASRIIRDMLTRARVICQYCGLMGIQRENFDDHLKRSCQKIEVVCSASDVYCPWKGLREELDEHVKTCVYHSLHSILNKLIIENRQLKEQIKQLKENCEEKYINQTNDIENTENYVQTSIKQLHEQLDIDENRIEKHQIEIEYLKNQIIDMNLQIKKLHEENHLKKLDILHFSQQYSQHQLQIKQLIKKLNFIINMIGYHNIPLLDRIEKCHHRLIGLNEKKLNDQDMIIIVQQMIMKNNSRELDLQSNEITHQGALILADALINNTNLEILYLHDNHIRDSGVQYLSHVLTTKNLTLKTLNLGSNEITDQGAEYLSEMLKNNRTLIHLYLHNNQISNRGIEILANILAYSNQTLEEFVIDQNKMIDDLCLETLGNMFVQNRSLKIFRIQECNLSEIGMTRLRDIEKLKHEFTLFV
jgi:hypothetical protein